MLQHRSRDSPSRRGPEHCAQLVSQPSEVFLASGVNRAIEITVKNLPDRFTDVEVSFMLVCLFVCLFVFK